MDPAAAPQYLSSTHGFVNTVQLNPTNGTQSDIWNKSTGISFVLFMVIGFCATLGAIGLTVAGYLIYRRFNRLRGERLARDEEARAVVPEPKEMYLVVHPGGTADVAHKDLDDSPRKMVLRNKPIQLSSAVLDVNPSTGYQVDIAENEELKKEESGVRILNLTASSSLGTGIERQNLGERFHRIRLDSVDATDSPRIMACHPRNDHGSLQARQREALQRADPSLGALSRQSTASETYQDEALLLTPRFARS